MFLFRKRCIFCGFRLEPYDCFWNDRLISVCKDCYKELDTANTPRIFDTPEHINAVYPTIVYKGDARSAIQSYKFFDHPRYGRAFSALMTDHLSNYPELLRFDTVVTVPISDRRRMERGYNQSEMLAKAVAEHLGLELRNDLLIKFLDTKKQSSLSTRDRRYNLTGAYAADADAKGRSILLVDDIYTTGATMEECAAMLTFAGAKIIVGITLAAVERRPKAQPYNPFAYGVDYSKKRK